MINFGSINVRGLRTKTRRRCLLRQAQKHCDILLVQETWANDKTVNDITSDFPGRWLFSNSKSNSKGVAIYFIRDFDIKVLDDNFKDNDGRQVGTALQINETKYFIISVYAPCVNSTRQSCENRTFLDSLRAEMVSRRNDGYKVIAAGDLNVIRDEVLDARGGMPRVFKSQSDWFTEMENIGFLDMHRFVKPIDQLETWQHGIRNSGKIFRRLDYFIADQWLTEKIISIKVLPTISDHRLLILGIDSGVEKNGPGMWKHHDGCLKDDEYCKQVEDAIEDALMVDSDDPRFKWEFLKYKIRETAIKFGKARSKLKKLERTKLEKLYAVQLTNSSPDAQDTALRLRKYYEEDDESLRFRAHVEEAEAGEKVTPYFFAKIKQNRFDSNIHRIKTSKYPGGTETREETMDALETHYSNEFNEQYPDVDVDESWWDGVAKISDDEKCDLDKPITLGTLGSVLYKDMSEGKSPGSDGLSVRFYMKFWQKLRHPLYNCLEKCWQKGELTESQKESVIRMISKKGKDPESIKGHRPISLMNCDSKIYAKAISRKLKKICSSIIGENQLAYMQGRIIQDGHVVISKAFEMYRQGNLKGLMTCIDFRSAFDSVKHSFIWKTLEQMNVGKCLIGHIKTLYKGAKSAVLNFGYKTNWIKLAKSCRQGDPVSSYLFILVLEILLTKLRNKIEPCEALKSEFKLSFSCFADDLTSFPKNKEQLKLTLEIVKSFGPISGLEMNMDKSEVLELGESAEGCGLKIQTEVKVTGIWFAKEQSRMNELNWEGCLSRIKTLYNAWSGRRLTIIGKANIIRAQVQPLISFIAGSQCLPAKIEEKLNKMTFAFLWNGADKVVRSLSYQRLNKGGLNIPNFRARVIAIQCNWIQRLQSAKNGIFKQVFTYDDIDWRDENAFNTPFPYRSENTYAAECVNSWLQSLRFVPFQQNSLVWPHATPQVRAALNQKCKQVTVTQALSGESLPSNCDFLMKATLKRVAKSVMNEIDKNWDREADKIRKNRFKKLNCILDWHGTARGHERRESLKSKYAERTLTSLKTQRAVYWLYIDQILPPPMRFRADLDFEYELDWLKIDGTKLFSDSKMQAFQWRSTHGKLYARKDLQRFNYIQDQNCTQCHAPIQNIKHVYIDCPRNAMLFANFERHYKLQTGLTDCEKLIGVDTNVSRTSLQLKKLNILRKCMYDAVHAEVILRWEHVLKSVDNLYIIEYAIADRNGTILKHLRNWEL
jgi:exonuclease III